MSDIINDKPPSMAFKPPPSTGGSGLPPLSSPGVSSGPPPGFAASSLSQNRRPPLANKTPQKPARVVRFLKVALIFAGGYMCASFADIDTVKHWVSRFNKKTGHAEVVTTKRETPKPKLEFYTTLPKEPQVATAKPKKVTREEPPKVVKEAPKVVTNKTVPAKVAPVSTVTAKNPDYQIQVASFRLKSEADRMKAQLILKGLTVNIKEIKRDNVSWYRVMIGPYHSQEQAKAAQVEIAKNERINGMIRKMDA